ncbi:MAG: 3-methyl-2-oxobutanoate hydroxymethyltransferase [Actinomycetaceae bacterium]|nr:3-methyl-2-oxobutanoate hydroxymethyltransferase [Actinomycetaceae bacterium]
MTDERTSPKRFRVHHFHERKERGEPITMLTCYDAITAQVFDESGVDCLLVGDSYGNTMLGYDSPVPVTLEDMLVPTAAVARAVRRAFVIADLPFGSYEQSQAQAVASAVRLMKAGAHAVKLEGGTRQAETVKALVAAGIPVVGHVGFTPQSANALGGPRVQGRTDEAQDALIDDAVDLQEAGAFMLVLEMVPADLARRITKILRIPTIGIGAGGDTDGQVLVWTDMAGMTSWAPKFSKSFGPVGQALRQAATDYCQAVATRQFPGPEHTFQ